MNKPHDSFYIHSPTSFTYRNPPVSVGFGASRDDDGRAESGP
ncbi:hypothetical protein MCEZE10_01615 [Sphingomonadaceae bacterium]